MVVLLWLPVALPKCQKPFWKQCTIRNLSSASCKTSVCPPESSIVGGLLWLWSSFHNVTLASQWEQNMKSKSKIWKAATAKIRLQNLSRFHPSSYSSSLMMMMTIKYVFEADYVFIMTWRQFKISIPARLGECRWHMTNMNIGHWAAAHAIYLWVLETFWNIFKCLKTTMNFSKHLTFIYSLKGWCLQWIHIFFRLISFS